MNNAVSCIRGALIFIGCICVSEQVSAQSYFDQISIVSSGDLLSPPSGEIVGFGNSPWPTFNARSIRVRASKAAVLEYLAMGKPIAADARSWDQAAKVKFTLPPVTYAERPRLRELELDGDSTLYSVYCQGVLATERGEIFFWRILNDRYLLLSDGKNYCIVETEYPIHIDSFRDSGPFETALDVPEDRDVLAVAEQPALMRREQPLTMLSTGEVAELFTAGHWITVPLTLGRGDSRLDDLLLPRVIEEVNKSELSKANLEELTALDVGGSELRSQTGAVLLKNETIVFWRALSANVLEIREDLDETSFVFRH